MSFRPSILDADPLTGLYCMAFAFTATGLAIFFITGYLQIGVTFSLIGGAFLLAAQRVSNKRKTKGKGAIWHFLIRLRHGTEAGLSGCPICQCAYRCHCNTLEAPK